MHIIVDYKEEKENCFYYNEVIEAVETCVKSVGIDKVVFKNFPLSEVKNLLTLIKKSTKTGTIIFNKRLIYESSEDALKICIPDSVDSDNSKCMFTISQDAK